MPSLIPYSLRKICSSPANRAPVASIKIDVEGSE